MPIQEGNIVFVKSQVMDDVDEGGGAATGTIITDGQMNNVFEDIYDLDRAYGRFKMRKLFLAVRQLGTDLYGGAKTIISSLPTDLALGYTLFTTNSPFDTRSDAADRVGAYLYKGPMWVGALNENHINGMRAISVIQRVNSELPGIGKTLCLTQNEGLSNETEQYVRVIKVEVVETTFTDDKGDYTRWIVTLSLSDALRYDFAGQTVNRYDIYNYTGKARLRNTSVADATRFYGSARLAAPAVIGDLKIRAASMYAALVPSAQTETPLVNQPMSPLITPMLASRDTALTYSVAGAIIAPGGRFVLDTGALPGSISVTLGSVIITDDRVGNALHGTTVVGIWTYSSGECNFNSAAPVASGTASVSYTPAAPVAQQAHTLALPVTAENRRLNWIETLVPVPAPGTYSLAYMTNGNWYVLSDNGAGIISGSDPSFGAGTLSYVTGSAPVTLGALPDVGSQIMMTWASPVHTAIRVGNAALDTTLTARHSLGEAFQPGSLTISFLVGGVPKTATVATSGIISGDCGGYASATVGDLRLEFAIPPDANSQIGLDYQRVTTVQQTLTGVAAPGGLATVSLGEAIEPGSLTVQWSTTSTEKHDAVTIVFKQEWHDGQWQQRGYVTLTHAEFVRRYEFSSTDNALGGIIGSGGVVNYSTGDLTLPLLPAVTESIWENVTGSWHPNDSATHTFTSGILNVSYTPAGASPTAVSIEIDLPPLQFRVIPRLLDETLVSGGLHFAWNGHRYTERSGVLYRDSSPTTGSATVAGSVDLLSGICTLISYVSGAGDLVVDALLTRFGSWSAIAASFRTSLAPIKPEALSLVAVTADGEQITGAADADGVIAGPWMRGAVDYQFGTGAAEFGHLVSGTWVPRAVDPSSIAYNAVAYAYLPLDSTILGIDPVRLPSDGRVPIYRAGDVVVVLHPLTNAPATPTLGNYTYTDDAGVEVTVSRYLLPCGRTRVAWVRIVDANGATVVLETAVDVDGHRATGLDRAQGLVYWETLAGLATPLTLTHTVADLRMITDAQISGWLTLARSLSHDFPAHDSIVAACLIHGDRRARVSAVWDQASWDGSWSDVHGSAATATLNTIDFPITVTNEGCDTDRWVLRWLTTTTVELISEHRGLVWSGSFPAYVSGDPVDIAPINPRTRTLTDGVYTGGTPFLIIPQRANGGGFSAGNIVRINTIGAIADFWIARSIQQSDEPDDSGADGCELYALGNINRP